MQLASDSDLLEALTALAVSLVPGGLVLDADSETRTLAYMLDAEHQVRWRPRRVLAQERRIRLALGDGEEINSPAPRRPPTRRPAPKEQTPGKGGAGDDADGVDRRDPLPSGLGALFPIRWSGPTQIDRTVALDVLLAIVVGVIVLTAAATDSSITLVIAVVVSLLGFLGSASLKTTAEGPAMSEPRRMNHRHPAVVGTRSSGRVESS